MKKISKRNDYLSWDEYFMGIAKLSAGRSKDPNTQVGACIVSNDKRILSCGYNGAPNGFDDDNMPWAREDIDIEIPKRVVDIKSIELLNIENNKITIKTTVSKGTYIRSLIKDICTNLNTIGTMTNLIRTKQGKYNIEDSYTLDELENAKLISIEEILKDEFTVEVDDDLYTKIINGAILDNIYQKDLIIFKKDGKILSAYRKYDKDNTKIKPDKMF